MRGEMRRMKDHCAIEASQKALKRKEYTGFPVKLPILHFLLQFRFYSSYAARICLGQTKIQKLWFAGRHRFELLKTNISALDASVPTNYIPSLKITKAEHLRLSLNEDEFTLLGPTKFIYFFSGATLFSKRPDSRHINSVEFKMY